MASVRLVLGTMTYGPNSQTSYEVAKKQLELFANSSAAQDVGQVLVDTARVYQKGATEEYIGNILEESPELKLAISLATKAAPRIGVGLTKEGVLNQCNASLEALKVDCVDLFYLHQPDINAPLMDSLAAVNQLHKEGKILEFGLSNYAAWQVIDIWHRCKAQGWICPTVYQGMYNALNRTVESELLPALRQCNIRFYGYNPLAGGFLTGKYTTMDDTTGGGRFSEAVYGKAGADTYAKRYWKVGYFDALKVVQEACDASGINMAEASLRWARHHSYLHGKFGDGIIFGASKFEHVEANLEGCEGGPLPAKILHAFDAAWEVARPHAESYMRGYGGVPGAADKFLVQF